MEATGKKRIGVARGGEGTQYASSLRRGGEVISYLLENFSHKYKPVDILIDKSGVWHLGGLPVEPKSLAHKVDIVWNMASPDVSRMLDHFSIPNVSPSPFSHALGNSRDMLREHMKKIGVSMPRSVVLSAYQRDFDGPPERYSIKKAKEVFEKFSSPWIVKSFTPDTNMGIHLAKTFDELVGAIDDGARHGKSILVEEFITGKVASLHSVPGFRREEVYIFPPSHVFGKISKEENEKLSILARDLHHHLGARHYLKADFILNKRGKIYFLDFESMPNLNSFSHFSQACESVGAKTHHVVEHILERVA